MYYKLVYFTSYTLQNLTQIRTYPSNKSQKFNMFMVLKISVLTLSIARLIHK